MGKFHQISTDLWPLIYIKKFSFPSSTMSIYYLSLLGLELSRSIRKQTIAYAKTKAQTSFAVTAKLISAFVFATQIVQSLFFLDAKSQVSNHLL